MTGPALNGNSVANDPASNDAPAVNGPAANDAPAVHGPAANGDPAVRGRPVPAAPLVAAAGDAIAAGRLAEAGVDVVVAYHSSTLRRHGLPSVAGLLPWGNANEMTLAIAPGVVEGAAGRPVLATVCANDALRPASSTIAELARFGVRGVVNAPTVGLLTGPVRKALEEAGLGFQREIDLVASARDHGLTTWAYAFTPGQARALARAGAEAVIVHLGITGAGSSRSQAARLLAATAGAVRAVEPSIPVLAHGGPLRDPEAFAAIGADDAGCGFFGASVFERAQDIGQAVRAWRTVLGPGDRSPRPHRTAAPARSQP